MLSVAVCTYNREKYIGQLLESIVANSLPKDAYEVILVDNNCTDRTHEVCAEFEKMHPDMRFVYVKETEQGLSAARNRAIREAKGDVLVYVDDDALVDTWYLQTIADYMQHHLDCMACGGPILPLYETAEPSWMTPYTRALLTAWMDYGSEVRAYPRGKYPGGGNAAYRVSVFEQTGLFNTNLGRKGASLAASEEKDIIDKMNALGMKYMYLPKMILHHIIPQKKLERDYFDRLTLQIGESERQRTLAISKSKYFQRMLQEAVKWCGTMVLLCGYTLVGEPQKGWKLVLFRRNVTKGLIGL